MRGILARRARHLLWLGVALSLTIACDEGDSGDPAVDAAGPDIAGDAALLDGAPSDGTAADAAAPDAALPDAAPPDAGGPEPRCSELVVVECQDQIIPELELQDEVAPGLIENLPWDGSWQSTVDATAGGFQPAVPQGYVYGKFTDAGLLRVEIDDEEALESADWDIAFRRYVIRLNGGASGPSCVSAARTPPGTEYATAEAPADEALYRVDSQYAPDCEFISDGSGLPTSPATALSSYYAYNGCVQMTGNVYVLRLADGRDLKLQVMGYYGPAEKQEYCQENGVADNPSGSGNISLQWAFLDAGE